MKTRNIKVKEGWMIDTGSILLAKPFWQEEEFRRSVILIMEHDEKGASGIILNKLSTLSVKDILPGIRLYQPVYYGGPTDKHIVSFVHRIDTLPGKIQITEGLYIGGDVEKVKELIHRNKIKGSDVRFLAGYVSWDAGQLEAEINEDKWWAGTIAADEVFVYDANKLWAYKLISTGHVYGVLHNYPDPVMN
jgi:putative transcriptional regulator